MLTKHLYSCHSETLLIRELIVPSVSCCHLTATVTAVTVNACLSSTAGARSGPKWQINAQHRASSGRGACTTSFLAACWTGDSWSWNSIHYSYLPARLRWHGREWGVVAKARFLHNCPSEHNPWCPCVPCVCCFCSAVEHGLACLQNATFHNSPTRL